MHILFAHHHIDKLKSIRQFFQANLDTLVVKEVSNFSGLVRQIEKGCFDVVLLDWDLPGMPPQMQVDFIELICPRTQVIVVTARPEIVEDALCSGVDVYVTCQDILDKLHGRILASQAVQIK